MQGRPVPWDIPTLKTRSALWALSPAGWKLSQDALLQSEFELPGRTAIVYNDIFLTYLIHDKAVDRFALADDAAIDNRYALGGFL